ncbi:hypothetical protein GGF32_006442 [Allomyces javanicus]|nr:hypothetical protein GGF32_006442 [Allomyces javanicus]
MRSTFVLPSTVYLPEQRKIYVFGGRQLITDTVLVIVDLDEVAIIDLAAPLTLDDPMSSAVQPAPFKLPAPDCSITSFAFQTDRDVIEVRLLAGLDAKSKPMRMWRIPDLLHATSVEIMPQAASTNASLAIFHPAWSASSAPFGKATAKRDDFQSVIFNGPNGSRYLIIMGFSLPLLEYVNIDKD